MLGIISTLLFDLMFFGIPVAAVIFFVISLRSYRKLRRQEGETPGSIPKGQLRSALVRTIVLGIIAGFTVLEVVGILALGFLAVAFM